MSLDDNVVTTEILKRKNKFEQSAVTKTTKTFHLRKIKFERKLLLNSKLPKMRLTR